MRVIRVKFKKTFRLATMLVHCSWPFFYDWFYLGHVKAVFQNWNYAKNFFFKSLTAFKKTLSLNQYLKFFVWVFFIKTCFILITKVTELHQIVGFILETCLLFFLYYRLFSPIFSIKNILKDFFLTFFTIYVIFFFLVAYVVYLIAPKITITFLLNLLISSLLWSSVLYLSNFFRYLLATFLSRTLWFVIFYIYRRFMFKIN